MIKKASLVTALILFSALITTPTTLVAQNKKEIVPSSASSGIRQFTLQTGLTDGTPIIITIVASASEEGRARSAMEAGTLRAQTLDRQINAPNGIDSQLNTLHSGQSLKLPPDIFAMINKAVTIAAQTDGWYDPASPSPSNWFTQRDWRRIALDPDTQTLRFKSNDMQVDLKRILRGAVADLCMDEILRAGFTNVMIEVGPVRWIAGRDIFTPWNIQIGFGGEGTQYAHRAFTYNLTNIAAATVTSDGLGQGLIDPKAKKAVPAKLMQSITVLAPDAMTATAYALAAYTLGPRIGMRFVEAHPEVKGVLVDNSGNLTASIGLGAATAAAPVAPVSTIGDSGPNDMKQKQNEEERDM